MPFDAKIAMSKHIFQSASSMLNWIASVIPNCRDSICHISYTYNDCEIREMIFLDICTRYNKISILLNASHFYIFYMK